MRAGDLPGVESVAIRLHPDYPERPEVFAERLLLCPAGCQVLDGPDGGLAGYLVSHPWGADGPPPLDSLLGALPAAPAAWHLHDIALLPGARGAGHAAAAVRGMLAAAAALGVPAATLVAIRGRQAMWEGLGFRAAPRQDAPGLASYGVGAVYMRRDSAQA
jgi:ribosomal protein S18 acetylase RimI-like enzyme